MARCAPAWTAPYVPLDGAFRAAPTGTVWFWSRIRNLNHTQGGAGDQPIATWVAPPTGEANTSHQTSTVHSPAGRSTSGGMA